MAKIFFHIEFSSSDDLCLRDDAGQVYPLRHLLEVCAPNKIFALDGNMGVGKTTFINHLCRELGTEDVVNSPTFAIVNVYDTNEGEVYHFDCYRLRDSREALDFGMEDYLYSDGYCFIEWPDVVAPLLPEDTVWVHLRELADGERVMEVETNQEISPIKQS